MKIRFVTFCCIAAILWVQTPQASASNGVGAEEVAIDLLVVRPVALVATVVGSALFVAALPFAIASKSTKKTARALVGHPARITFTRDLGDLDDL